jgi:uncharacterized protein (TIGR03000 family)
MFRRSFSVAACGALALLLTAAEASQAQFAFFPVGRGGTGAVFGPRGGFFFPGAFGGAPFYPYGYGYGPSYSQSYASASVSINMPTPIYYGAASLPGYSAGYSSPRIVSPPPGVGLRTADAGEAANYPTLSSDYATRYPVSPPVSLVAAMTERAGDGACVEVRVPDSAQIWFDGQKTSQTGTERIFTSPGLESGQDYTYEVRACWTLDGKTVDQTRKVAVHAGNHVVVDFLR